MSRRRLQRHTVEPLIDTFVPVPMLLQSVDQPLDVMKIIDISTPVEQVIDEHKIISQDSIPQRDALRVPQLVEQLVGRAGVLLLRLLTRGGHGAGTVLGRRWLRMVPVLWTRPDGELLVEVGHATHPCQFHRSRSRSWTVAVADVPVITQLKFLQSLPNDSVPVVLQRQVSTVQTVQKTREIPQRVWSTFL